MTRVVIDASLAVPWFVPETGPRADAARGVLDDVSARRVRPVVPELFFYEVLSVLARRLPEPGSAADAVERLMALGLDRVALDMDAARRAETIARDYGLTGYDASYAALAESLGVEWWTFDDEARERIAPLGVAKAPPAATGE